MNTYRKAISQQILDPSCFLFRLYNFYGATMNTIMYQMIIVMRFGRDVKSCHQTSSFLIREMSSKYQVLFT